MSILVFLDLKAILFTLVIAGLSLALYWKTTNVSLRLTAIGSFMQTMTLAFGFAYIIYSLAVLDSLDMLGPSLAVSLLTPLYGALINLGIKIYVRFYGGETAVRNA